MRLLLVAVDDSPRAQAVVDTAVTIARGCGARIVLLRAAGVASELPHDALAMSPSDVAEGVDHAARAELEALETTVPEALRGGVRVEFGAPWSVIERVAAHECADLIVIGSHGYGAVDRLLGTTAAKVVNHADRSVRVVRAPDRLVEPVTASSPRASSSAF